MKNNKINRKKIYYSTQTKLAIKNFPFTTSAVHKEFIYAISQIKEAAALANSSAGNIDKEIAKAIVAASQQIRQGDFDDQFFLPGVQGGAGTSIHMNVNEVIASRASEILSKKKAIIVVHPNDHVNRSQSTNDVCPSALKIASIPLAKELTKTLEEASTAFRKKAREFADIPKLGRTHLQDAVPTTLGEEFSSYAAIVLRNKTRISLVLDTYLYDLNIGGSAIGNSVNASPDYIKALYRYLQEVTRLPLKPAASLMSQTSSYTDFVMLSQALVDATLDFSKIASDFRLLASGPKGGLAELQLAELQAGSSIMPGKVNPILPETVNQLYFLVSGNNLSIEHAAHAAQLELAAMLPIIADRLIASLKFTTEVVRAFTKECLLKVTANEERCRELLELSNAYATFLTPKFGYEYISSLVKEANKNGKTLRQILTREGIDLEKFKKTTPASTQNEYSQSQ